MKNITILYSKKLFFFCLFMISFSGIAQNFTVSLANGAAPTASTFEVDIVLTVNAPVAGIRLASVSTGVNYDPTILNGGTPCTTAGCGSWAYIPGTKSPAIAALIATNNTNRATPVGHLRTVGTNLAASSSIDIPPGVYTIGRYRFTNTVAFTPGSNANLWLQPTNTNPTGSTNTIVSFYPFGAVTPLSAYTTTLPAAGAGLTLSHTASSTFSIPLGAICSTSGTFTETPVTCFGDSNGTATITMSPIPTSLNATYVLDGGSPTSVTLSATGQFTISGLTAGAHTLSVTGNGTCTTPVSVPLTIGGPSAPLTNTTTISACDSYTWAVTGATYTVSGPQTGTTINGSGCTVNETLNLTINPSPVTTAYSICQGGTVVGGLVSTLGGGGGSPLPNYSGDTTGAPTYNRTVAMNQGGTCTDSSVGTAVLYRTHIFVAPATGAYVFSMCGNATWDTFLSLYQGTFNPTGFCIGNTLVEAGDDNCGSQSEVTVTLVQGTSYTLVAAGFENTDFGTYSITSTAPVTPPSIEWYTSLAALTPIGTGSPFNPVGVDGSGITDTNTVAATTFYAQFPGSTCRTPALFTITSLIPNTTTITACNSYTWAVNGTTYTSSGTYSSVTGCNTETLNLTINAIDYANLQFPATSTICQGGTFTTYGQVYEPGITEAAGQGAGIDVEFGISPNGSNTNPSLWTNWIPAVFNVQVGNNDEYQITTGAALPSGTYYYTFRYKLSSCTTWQYGGFPNGFWNGTTQNSGVLTINPLTTNGNVTTSICAGSSYIWPLPNGTGLTYTTAQTDLINTVGCNTATLNLTITPLTTNGSITTSICDGSSYIWPLPNGTGLTYTTAQTNLTNTVGCNTATLNLSITPLTTNGSVTSSICAGSSYIWPLPNGTGLTYTTAQTGLTRTVGCNTATLNLTVTPLTSNGNVTTSICAGSSYVWPLPNGTGLTYTTAQNGLTNIVGCNTATLNLSITPLTTNGSVTTSICAGSSYVWPLPNGTGLTYTTAQTALTNVVGCNTATLNLTITPLTTNGSVTNSICAGSSYVWPLPNGTGLTYTTAQTNLTNTVGCNTATLNLTITPLTTNGSVTNSICAGSSYVWPLPNGTGLTYTTAQTNLTNTVGCNTATLNLTITPLTTNGTVTTSICAGGSYTWAAPGTGLSYTTAQTNLTNTVGCNTATLNLTITPLTTNGTVTTSICDGSSYTWAAPGTGLSYTTAQTNLTNTVGCNTATLNLTINTAPTPTGSALQSFNVVNLNNATIASLVVSPAGVIWYASLLDAQNGTNPLLSTTVITNGSTYWAVNVVGGCRSTPFAVAVTVTLGNEEFDNLNFSFYPNPTSSILNITYSRVISDILLFNLLGQEVMAKKANETEVQIDLSQLAEATYFVKVTSEGREKIIKVIKRN